MLNVDHDKCTGCELCKEICPRQAIYFKVTEGFRYPVIDSTKCIDCDLCNKKCPMIKKEFNLNDYPRTYAGWTCDSLQRENCTSGGIAFELSKHILVNGGVVAGVAWKDGFKDAEYRLIDKVEDLSLITQTKYFQPQMNGIYAKIKEVLNAGREVLFIGTSCSNAGLLSYLGEPFNNLYCCDFICRGYTTQLYHEKRVKDLEQKYNSKIVNLQYKNKKKGWEHFGTKFDFLNGESYYVNRADDPYEYMLSANDYVTRLSCFDCKFRDSRRIADITLGDFWGIKNVGKEDKRLGISAILVHTSKGAKLLSSIGDHIVLEERGIWEISQGNHCLKGQLQLKQGREKFYFDLCNQSIDYIHNKYGNIKKNKAKLLCKRLLRMINIMVRTDIIRFIYINYISKAVQRKRGVFLFPYKGTRFNLENGSKIILNENVFLNNSKHKHSNEQTYLHLYSDALLCIEGTTKIAAGGTIDVLTGAKLKIGKLNANYNMTIICSNEINIGDDVEVGRNVTIYDSNYHQTGFNKKMSGRPVNIGNHVWLCTGVCITKGVDIQEGAICGIGAVVTRNVKGRNMVLGNPAKLMMEDMEW